MKEAAALVLVVLTLTGCKKIVDYYRPPNNTTLTCKIVGYTYDYYGDNFSTTINYDENGNPSVITYKNIYLPKGFTIETFEYDELNRLIVHSPDPYMGNTRIYVYEGTSTVPIRDTAIDASGNIYLETFRTDGNGRIVREEIKQIHKEDDDDWEFQTEVYSYYYDLRGNRQANPFDHPWNKTIRYSDKPSLYSLSPAWHIIYRDFSRNSVMNVKRYNEAGLPVQFNFSEFAYWQPFLDLTLNATIQYDCK